MTAEKKPASEKRTSKTKTHAKSYKKSRSSDEVRSSGSSETDRMVQPEYKYRLVKGTVNPDREHFGIHFGQDDKVVALIAQGPGKTFVVQYLVGPGLSYQGKIDILREVQREIMFYLLEDGPRSVFHDPWTYTKYHCATAANMYSPVHWSWYPDSPVGAEQPQHLAQNVKRVVICAKCKSKFIVSGPMPLTCPKSGTIKSIRRPRKG